MSSTAIATMSSKQLAEGTTFSPRQVDLIRDQIMPGAADEELMLFVQVASSRGLDPFRKHIYAVSRKTKNQQGQWVDKWSYQVSIDGLRLIAERSGRYEGQTLPQWCGQDGNWKDVWLANEPPAAAKVGVYLKGAREPVYAIALYKTFVQLNKEGKPTKFWAEMPEHMLAKVAESQALRKAFPEEAGGLYTTEEMQQANNPRHVEISGHVVDVESGEIDPVQERQHVARELWSLARDTFHWSKDDLEAVAMEMTGVNLVNLSAEGLRELYQKIVVTSAEEREALLNVATTGE